MARLGREGGSATRGIEQNSSVQAKRSPNDLLRVLPDLPEMALIDNAFSVAPGNAFGPGGSNGKPAVRRVDRDLADRLIVALGPRGC